MTHSRALSTHEKSGPAPQKRFPETVEIVDFLEEICYTYYSKFQAHRLQKNQAVT